MPGGEGAGGVRAGVRYELDALQIMSAFDTTSHTHMTPCDTTLSHSLICIPSPFPRRGIAVVEAVRAALERTDVTVHYADEVKGAMMR